jgi:hypothetical protein
VLVFDVADDEGVEIGVILKVLPQDGGHVGSGEHHTEALLPLATQQILEGLLPLDGHDCDFE